MGHRKRCTASEPRHIVVEANISNPRESDACRVLFKLRLVPLSAPNTGGTPDRGEHRSWPSPFFDVTSPRHVAHIERGLQLPEVLLTLQPWKFVQRATIVVDPPATDRHFQLEIDCLVERLKTSFNRRVVARTCFSLTAE